MITDWDIDDVQQDPHGTLFHIADLEAELVALRELLSRTHLQLKYNYRDKAMLQADIRAALLENEVKGE